MGKLSNRFQIEKMNVNKINDLIKLIDKDIVDDFVSTSSTLLRKRVKLSLIEMSSELN